MGEYIEREAVMEAVKQEREYVGKYSIEEEHAWAVGFQQGVTFALSDISAIPAADVAPVRRGEWIDDYGESWRCSVCGAETYVDEDWRGKNDKDYKMNFCHYCGARMEADNG